MLFLNNNIIYVTFNSVQIQLFLPPIFSVYLPEHA